MIPQMMTPGQVLEHMKEFPSHDVWSTSNEGGNLRLDCLMCLGLHAAEEREKKSDKFVEEWKKHPEMSYGEMQKSAEEMSRENISRGRNRSSEARTVNEPRIFHHRAGSSACTRECRGYPHVDDEDVISRIEENGWVECTQPVTCEHENHTVFGGVRFGRVKK